MSIPKVEDLTEAPVVGRFYLVPCVAVEEHGRFFQPKGLVPVIGPKHDDREHVNFPWKHWHYDLRFLTGAQLTMLPGSPFSHALGAVRFDREHTPIAEVAATAVLRRMRCRREMPQYPHRTVERLWLPQLRTAHTDKRVTCGRCPHRGLPIASLPREDGTDIVTCPGHGLRWNLATGELIREASAC